MRLHPLSLKTLLARGVLALFLLFAQQQAALHWLSHAVEETRKQAPHSPASSACDECSLLAAFGAAAPAAANALPILTAHFAVAFGAEPASAAAAGFLAYRSRAPPALS